jgi:hypothetical protein
MATTTGSWINNDANYGLQLFFSTQKIEVNNAVTIVKSTSDKSLFPFCYLFKETNWFHSII